MIDGISLTGSKVFQAGNDRDFEGATMQLKLKRSQRSAGMLGGKVMYMLDARAELTGEERALYQQHRQLTRL